MATSQQPKVRKVNTILVKPRAAKFKIDFEDEPKKKDKSKMQPYLVIANGEMGFQTKFMSQYRGGYGWFDILAFSEIQQDNIFVRCQDFNYGEDNIILGEGIIDISKQLQDPPEEEVRLILSLYKNSKKTGEIMFELEFLQNRFQDIVRAYDPIRLKKGEEVFKKLQYLNQEERHKEIKIKSSDPSVVQVLNSQIKMKPKIQDEIKLKIVAPKKKYAEVTLDIITTVEDSQGSNPEYCIEEVLFFRVYCD